MHGVWLLFPAVTTSAFDVASARRLPPPQGQGPADGANPLSLAQLSQVPIPDSCVTVERNDDEKLKHSFSGLGLFPFHSYSISGTPQPTRPPPSSLRGAVLGTFE